MFTNEFEFDSTITTVIVSPIGFGARSGAGRPRCPFFFPDGFGWDMGGTMGPTIQKKCRASAASAVPTRPTVPTPTGPTGERKATAMEHATAWATHGGAVVVVVVVVVVVAASSSGSAGVCSFKSVLLLHTRLHVHDFTI